MKRSRTVLLALALLLPGCSGADVIPAGKMASILHDMYVLDAQIAVTSEYVTMADTTSVYGAILNEYGYTPEDFNRSLDYYLASPGRFREVSNKAHKQFEEEVSGSEFNPEDVMPELLDAEGKQLRSRTRRLSKPSSAPKQEL